MKDYFSVIHKFITHTLVIFSITLIFVTVFGIFCPQNIMEYSTMFSFGELGISFDTILQMLLFSTVITSINSIFFSEKIFKNMIGLWKIILVTVSIIITAIIFVLCFKWFPMNLIEAWIGFFVSFGIFFAISILITIIKTKCDAKKYDELLENYKKKHIMEEKDDECN